MARCSWGLLLALGLLPSAPAPLLAGLWDSDALKQEGSRLSDAEPKVNNQAEPGFIASWWSQPAVRVIVGVVALLVVLAVVVAWLGRTGPRQPPGLPD